MIERKQDRTIDNNKKANKQTAKTSKNLFTLNLNLLTTQHSIPFSLSPLALRVATLIRSYCIVFVDIRILLCVFPDCTSISEWNEMNSLKIGFFVVVLCYPTVRWYEYEQEHEHTRTESVHTYIHALLTHVNWIHTHTRAHHTYIHMCTC